MLAHPFLGKAFLIKSVCKFNIVKNMRVFYICYAMYHYISFYFVLLNFHLLISFKSFQAGFYSIVHGRGPYYRSNLGTNSPRTTC